MVQLADQLFRTQEDLGLNPAIGKLLKYIQLNMTSISFNMKYYIIYVIIK